MRNVQGERFMERYDERLELAPRDIVSRSIVAEMRRTGSRNVFLDMTALDAAFLKERFPKIDETCRFYGLDITTSPIPVSPASHYCMGGVRTAVGRTTVPGFRRQASSRYGRSRATAASTRCLSTGFGAGPARRRAT